VNQAVGDGVLAQLQEPDSIKLGGPVGLGEHLVDVAFQLCAEFLEEILEQQGKKLASAVNKAKEME